jgi:tetratricopeptide (TPR) repeat protein
MQKNSVTVVLALLAMLACPSALADGLISKGHVNGPYTVLTLTKDQISALDHGNKKIVLTIDQRKTLADLKNAERVRELRVVPVTTETCTCELVNVAVRTGTDSIEVADHLFGRDFAQQDREQVLWTSRGNEQQQAEKAESNNFFRSMEARLNLQGKAESNSEKAIDCFKSALKMNPNYKWARRNLASTYSTLAHNSLYNKPDYEKSAHYYELALSAADPTDQLFIESTKTELKAVNSHRPKTRTRY